MHLLDPIWTFFFAHQEALTTLFLSLIALLKLTAWGRAQSAALDAVVGVIERVGDKKIKTDIATREAHLQRAVKDALRDAVAKVDPKKIAVGLARRVGREIVRGVLPRK